MKKYYSLLFLLTSVLVGWSQQQISPVTWSTQYNLLKENKEEITITATINPGWHIYSVTETDAGPIKTSFRFNTTNDYVLIDDVIEIDPIQQYDKTFETELLIFENTAVFKHRIKRKNNNAFTITGELEFMTCNDTQCLPPKTVPFTVNVPASILKN